MRKIAFLAMLVVGLAGCATTGPSTTFGNFALSVPASLTQVMADDAAKQLVAVYPPASTQLDLQHATQDAFGVSLVESLRTKGYAILEFKPAAQAAAVVTNDPANSSKPLRYIVDQAESNLYRVTLLVGNQSLTRAYATAQNGTLYPAGAWLRKE